MDANGRPNHIEDVLATLHTGCWFGWSDSKNKVYANLIIHDGSKSKPTESELTTELAAQQTAFDNAAYSRNRKTAYPSVTDFMEAYTEKEIGSDSTKWDAYVIAYNKVRTDNPKS